MKANEMASAIVKNNLDIMKAEIELSRLKLERQLMYFEMEAAKAPKRAAVLSQEFEQDLPKE